MILAAQRTFFTEPFNPLQFQPLIWLSDTGSDPSVWADSSGRNLNLTQATPSFRPTIIPNALNGRQVRNFNGTNNRLTRSTAVFPSASSFAAFIVARVIPRVWIPGNFNNLSTLVDTDHAAIRGFVMQTREDLSLDLMSSSSSPVSINPGPTSTYRPNTYQIFSHQTILGGNSFMGVNGLMAPFTNTSSWVNSTSAFAVGCWLNNGNPVRFLNGDIAELLIVPNVLSTSDRQSIENYLTIKWGITNVFIGDYVTQIQAMSPSVWLTDSGTDPSVWEDTSGNGRNLIQATPENQPDIIPNALNGRQVRRFNGVSDQLYNSNIGVSCQSNFTIFAVHKYNSLTSVRTGWQMVCGLGLDGTQTTTASGQLLLQRISTTANSIGGHNAGVTTTNISIDTTSTSGLLIPRVSMIRRSGGTNGLNGAVSVKSNTVFVNSTQSWTTSSTLSSFQVGGNQQTGTDFFNGDVAEVLVFNRAVTDAERNTISNYLSRKYAIPV